LKGLDTARRDDLRSEIEKRIKRPVAIIGIGNILRGDDGLGSRFIGLLKENCVKAALFDCGTAPENYIFPILATSCETAILVDAADLGATPGEVRVIGLDAVANIGFSTHNPSPRLFADLLRTARSDLNIFVVSIQPKTTLLGQPISSEVLTSMELLRDIFLQVL
jgi:hydrogenase 3 maturation protease